MLSVFTKIVHVSNISRPEHLLACLDHLAAFTPREIDQVRRWAGSGKKYVHAACLVTLIRCSRIIWAYY